jgi:predicted nucleic acid-binding protein
MPTSVDPKWAADTSFAVAALDGAHVAHDPCAAVARARRPVLAGHAVFETFSVLTRLPGAGRVHPEVAANLIDRAFPGRCWLTARQHDALLGRAGTLGLAGGMVYDALVGEAARIAGLTLLTRDRRAVRTYGLLGVPFELVPD